MLYTAIQAKGFPSARTEVKAFFLPLRSVPLEIRPLRNQRLGPEATRNTGLLVDVEQIVIARCAHNELDVIDADAFRELEVRTVVRAVGMKATSVGSLSEPFFWIIALTCSHGTKSPLP